MAKKRIKRPKFISFPGTFVHPHLHEPSFGTEDYPKPAGEFSVKLKGKLTDPKVKKLLAQLQPMHDEAVERGKEAFKELKVAHRKKLQKENGKAGIKINDLYTEVFDEETEEPTGEILMKFAMTYSGKYKSGPKAGKKWKRKPAIFDAVSSQPMSNPPEIWGGTKGKVSFEVGTDPEGQPGYFIEGSGAVGLKLHLQAARILELVTAGQRSANDYGFDDEEEEGGYTHDDSAKEEDEDDASDDDEDDEVEEKARKRKPTKGKGSSKRKAKVEEDDDADEDDDDNIDF